MARNLSVDQFKQLMARIPKEVAKALQGAVDDAGTSLARSMVAAAPKGKDARRELSESIRLERGRHPLRVLVKAGGPLTQTPQGSDYALHVEFGTEKQIAYPFFWPTYRARKRSIRTQISKRIKPAIAKVVRLE